MNTDKDLKLVATDLVVTMDYVLTVEGEMWDSSEEEGPIQFLQGHGNIIKGLEQQISGMAIGESREIRVDPESGYGLFDPDQIVDVPMSEFPEEIPLEPGVELEMKDKEGDTLFARIISVGKTRVKMDFNHPLAGRELHFEVAILDLREPTPEELDHGHVHKSEE
jgi:FKBP-type peptidyl-prolyl cis-trans isomerase SlyD